MQSLWAKLLAGEANRPGSFSRRTIELIATFEKSDAQLFTALCSFGWVIGNNMTPVVFDVEAPIYTSVGISFVALSHLDEVGLVTFAITGLTRQRLPKEIPSEYYGRRAKIEFPQESNNRLDVGLVMLTAVGQELALICGSRPIDGFYDYVCDLWQRAGSKVVRYPSVRTPEDQPPPTKSP